MHKQAQTHVGILIILVLMVLVFLCLAFLVVFGEEYFNSNRSDSQSSANFGVNGGETNSERGDFSSEPVVIIVNKNNEEKPNGKTGLNYYNYVNYRDWKQETDSQCKVYVQNRGYFPSSFTVKFYLKDKDNERTTKIMEGYIRDGERKTFSVSLKNEQTCDYEVFVGNRMMAQYQQYGYENVEVPMYYFYHHSNCYYSDNDCD